MHFRSKGFSRQDAPYPTLARHSLPTLDCVCVFTCVHAWSPGHTLLSGEVPLSDHFPAKGFVSFPGSSPFQCSFLSKVTCLGLSP